MIKYVTPVVLALLFAVPCMAQDDPPTLEIGMGYGNIGVGVDKLVGAAAPSEHHSGFTMHQDYNLGSWFGIENYIGYYSMGSGVQLFADTVGARVAYRKIEKATPFATVGFGGASLQLNGSSVGAKAFRLGGGVDWALGPSAAIRTEWTRMSFGGFVSGVGWPTGSNVSLGLVFRLGE